MSVTVFPELSIVIVNWNSLRYLRECLVSVVTETHGLSYEVTVVDNGSTDDGIDQLMSEFPFARLIKIPGNVGFARANNIGFRDTRSPHVLFLNPDTRIKGPALPVMVGVLNQLPDAGIVGCRLLNSDLTLQTSCVQRFPTVLSQALGADLLYARFPRLSLWGLGPLREATRDPVLAEVVSGACLMVRRKVFEAVGQFSEEYFMYAEDVDLCHQAGKAGWRCYYTPQATVVHHGGGSSRQRSVTSWAAVVQCGAKLQFMRKTRGLAYGDLYRLAMATSAAIRWLLLAGTAVLRGGRSRNERIRMTMAKWRAIFWWSLRPDTTLRRLTTTGLE